MDIGIHLIQETFRPRRVIQGSEVAWTEDDQIERVVVYHAEISRSWVTELEKCGLKEVVYEPYKFKGNDSVVKARSLVAPLTIGFSVLKERTTDAVINAFILNYLAACRDHPTANVRLRV